MSQDLYALALQAHQAGRLKEAERHYRMMLKANPRHPVALANLGALNLQRGDRREGLKLLDASLQIAPDQPHALNSRANGLKAAGRYEDALRDYDRAVRLQPDFIDALYNKGVVLHEIGRMEEAATAHDQVLALDPGHAGTLWNKALTLIHLGRYPEGWALHEHRWSSEQFAGQREPFAQPLWLGREPIAGKTILVYFEQGYGDAINALRYARPLADLGAKVIAWVPPSLSELAEGVEGVSQVCVSGEPMPPFDYQAPMMSLPLALGTTFETIPWDGPYIRAPGPSVQKWADRLGSHPEGKRRVGVVVSGSATQKNDHNRSIPLAMMAAALNRADDNISLQVEYRPNDRHALKSSGLRSFADQIESFSDTAGLIANLDLVVTVCTSVAHLAGAMGKPTWVLLCRVPDHRWGLQGETTPWYPSMRLFRQSKAGDWADVMARVKAALA